MAGTKHLEPSCLGCLFLISQVLLFSSKSLNLSIELETKKHFSGNFLLPLLPRLSPLLRSLSFQVVFVAFQAMYRLNLTSISVSARVIWFICGGHV